MPDDWISLQKHTEWAVKAITRGQLADHAQLVQLGNKVWKAKLEYARMKRRFNKAKLDYIRMKKRFYKAKLAHIKMKIQFYKAKLDYVG